MHLTISLRLKLFLVHANMWCFGFSPSNFIFLKKFVAKTFFLIRRRGDCRSFSSFYGKLAPVQFLKPALHKTTICHTSTKISHQPSFTKAQRGSTSSSCLTRPAFVTRQLKHRINNHFVRHNTNLLLLLLLL